jgi:hypothetical protein
MGARLLKMLMFGALVRKSDLREFAILVPGHAIALEDLRLMATISRSSFWWSSPYRDSVKI